MTQSRIAFMPSTYKVLKLKNESLNSCFKLRKVLKAKLEKKKCAKRHEAQRSAINKTVKSKR